MSMKKIDAYSALFTHLIQTGNSSILQPVATRYVEWSLDLLAAPRTAGRDQWKKLYRAARIARQEVRDADAHQFFWWEEHIGMWVYSTVAYCDDWRIHGTGSSPASALADASLQMADMV